MIELRNITKTYKTNRGKAVEALKNVSIKFPQTGMVFISGKSGCGKSTLLNIIGGLDVADKGEIIIKGKSSKAFTAANFDSYRNTYLGFIFQDYNILEDFTVGANIALAMELQGKKATEKDLNAILEQVELNGLADRKPSQLSGGQRQRVAIARALVKNPEIIMADEPTGALDSAMGKQVLMTLKKLSKDKLVIVVSHDLEFAETYGDRIITMSDGEVISDKEKTIIEAKQKDTGVAVIDDSIIQIKKGYKLTEEDLAMINEYLSKNENDSVISLDPTTNEQFRKSSNITVEGDREVFLDTDQDSLSERTKEYDSMDLIKSKLPLKSTLKMAVSSMKVKPIRLFFIILLSVVAFGLFGAAFTMATYNKESSMIASLKEGNINYLTFAKEKEVSGKTKSKFKEAVNLENEDVNKIKSAFPDKTFLKVLPKDMFYQVADLKKVEQKRFYQPQIVGLSSIDDHAISEFGMSYIGSLPKADDDIMITEYTYSVLKECGYKNPKDGKTLPITKPQDLVGRELECTGDGLNKKFKISGVLKTNFSSTIYDQYKKEKDNDASEKLSNILKESQMIDVLGKSYEQLGFISPNNFAKLEKEPVFYDLMSFGTQLNFEEPESKNFKDSTFRFFLPFSETDEKNIVFFDKNKKTLGENEVLLPIGMAQSIDVKTPEGQKNLGDLLSTAILNANENADAEDYKNLLRSYGPLMPFKTIKYNLLSLNNGVPKSKDGELKVVGFFFKAGNDQSLYTGILNDTFVSKTGIQKPGKYSMVISNMPKDHDEIKQAVKFSNEEKNGTVYPMKNSATISVDFINNIVKILLPTFVFLGSLLAIFASILFMTFIFTSIKYKQHDIGILRAIGARGMDILGIFFSESLIISLINGVLASILAAAGVFGINHSINKILQTGVTLFSFGPIQFLIVIAISALSAVIASALPVYMISKQKPIDAIRNH